MEGEERMRKDNLKDPSGGFSHFLTTIATSAYDTTHNKGITQEDTRYLKSPTNDAPEMIAPF